ncbi:MAG: hydroxymethylglutaryl-CoA synthase [Thermoprotei archaeon]|nr:hydroxymethylglutaryl-CoA synthase [Thermoproteales archaeon]RLE77821.1 MAG: hydroxymethylglutaryl-CoA synthase [Thermoprotei archaeon]RLE85880.1 MAG: hydroxymethylglutaryl-CoA synthase [Thermoprotei archaeon]
MKPLKKVGIAGYGAYIPMYRIKDEEIARVWGRDVRRTPIQEKSVPGIDEDSLTFSVEAAQNAILRAKVSPQEIEAVYVGSESPPYAVKPTATVVAEALGITPRLIAIDMEFACRAGTTAMQSVMGLVASEMIKYGLAIGTDTAQGRPQDELEYTAASGAAAFILGPHNSENVALIEGSYSYVTDTPDFWRREGEFYPMHSFRFTGEPAYFHHIYHAAIGLMESLGLKNSDFDYVVFHQPNVKFPLKIAKLLGFSADKIKDGLLTGIIGNTYAAASMIGLAAVLDKAKPGERILMVSFGSGAGSDAFSIIVQDAIEEKRNLAPLVEDYIKRKKYVDYATYVRLRRKLRR